MNYFITFYLIIIISSQKFQNVSHITGKSFLRLLCKFYIGPLVVMSQTRASRWAQRNFFIQQMNVKTNNKETKWTLIKSNEKIFTNLYLLSFSLGIVLWEITTRKKPFEGLYVQICSQHPTLKWF